MTLPRATKLSRRTFLAASGALSSPWVIPASALGLDEKPAPSNRITLGFIGVGGMGGGHLGKHLSSAEVQVLAVCDVDQPRREAAKKRVEDAYAAKSSGAYRGCEAYNDLRDLIARPDIDAVVIATGDRWHALATTMAAKAGKDIYCEKPVSLTIAEAREMTNTVRRYGRVCQVGLQQRSTPEFQLAVRLIHSGALGKLRRVYVYFAGTSREVDLPAEPVPPGLDWDLWLGPAPYRPFNGRFHHFGHPDRRFAYWDFCRDFGGGNLTTNAVHSLDVAQWAQKLDHSGPVKIAPPGVGEFHDLTYHYPNDVLVQVIGRKLDPNRHEIPQGWEPYYSLQNFGGLYVGDKGWLHVGRQGFLKCYPTNLLPEMTARDDTERSVGWHHADWYDAIRTRRRPNCDIAIGAQSTIVSHLGCIAHWTNRVLHWDPVKEEFIGDEEANRMRSRAMREPWTL